MRDYASVVAATALVGAAVGLVLVAIDATVGKLLTDRWGWVAR